MSDMKKEIGSEFWEVPTIESDTALLPKETQWFGSGRGALEYIISDIRKNRKMKTVALPSWCCESMIKPFVDAGVEVFFYPVCTEAGFSQNLQGINADCVLILDYFGFVCGSILEDFDGTIIRDVTHSLFSNSYYDAQYYFGSLRKWAGFWTGGVGWGFDCEKRPANETYIALRQNAMEMKKAYIEGSSLSKDYLEVFSQAEQSLKKCAVAGAAIRDVALAEKVDVHFIRKRRRENAARLLDAFSDIAVFPRMGEQDCPLFVPITVPDGKRNGLRQHLIEHQIYCPVHWPISKYHRLDNDTKKVYEQELSLVCDHRYSVADMDRMIKTIEEFLER